MMLLMIGVLAWGYFGSLRIGVTTYDIFLPEWADTDKSMTVLLVSDPHFRPNGSPDTFTDADVQDLITKINQCQADVVLLLGDYTYGKSTETAMNPNAYARLLAQSIRSPHIYAILGNHDTWYGRETITEAFNNANIRVLEGQTAFATDKTGQAEIQIMGVPDIYTMGADAVTKSLLPRRDAQTPVIIMSHGPAADSILPHDANLVVCGHTHGGQLCLPGGYPIIQPFDITPPEELRQGLFPRSNGSQMIITRGIGFSIFPLRLFCPPEIVLIRLTGNPKMRNAIL
jgi:predicted MPP superfamily phosphohydrolase